MHDPNLRHPARRRNEPTVPLRVARQLRDERDQLIDALRSTRSQVEQLSAKLRAAHQDRATLDDQLRNSAEQIQHLRQQLQLAQRARDEALELVDSLQEQLLQLEEQPTPAEPQPEPKIDTLQAQLQEVHQDLQRIQQRRQQEINQAVLQERIRMLARLGSVLDSVMRALSNSTDRDSPWHQGLERIYAQIQQLLQQEDVEILADVGQPFDPSLHEAISVVADPAQPPQHIVWVERHGLRLPDGQLIRPAQVVVSR